ncbi:flagellar basal body rod C-terminal domain-containing protein [Plastorhodobacter daqingensis]|uniref:Flagellar basal-body rod protein FlgF n=1 Tax=Plastorhodobacter daqingensis TaxID=1387281 RepID=A0ABW2UK18_9RHOB
MDRMIHTALSALHNLRDSRTITAQNLANQNVPGFRRDLPNEGGSRFMAQFDEISARAFPLERGPHLFSDLAGPLVETGEPADVALADRGYFYVQPTGGGGLALTRRGDLSRDAEGVLRNGAGDALLDVELQPITVDAWRAIQINELGQIWIEPQEGQPGQIELAATLATVDPEGLLLRKGPDGRIRPAEGPLPPPDQRGRVQQGYLESSNVNAVEELVLSLELQREFELNVKLITTAREIDEGGARLLRLPET